jgi:glycerol-3-phosphate dehydrogenase
VGGKWTTYRHMAEDCVNHAITLGELPDVPSKTHDLKIHGYKQEDSLTSLGVYGSDADAILALAAATSVSASSSILRCPTSPPK